MKKWKYFAGMVVLVSILLSACVGFNLAQAAPKATVTASSAPAAVQPTAKSVAAPVATAQPIVVPSRLV